MRAAQPWTEAFFWCLTVHVVCAKEKAETVEEVMMSEYKAEEHRVTVCLNKGYLFR